MLVEKEVEDKKKSMKKVGHFPTIFDKRKERQKPEQEEKTEARTGRKDRSQKKKEKTGASKDRG